MTDESALFSVSAVWVALLLVVTASLALTAGIAIGSGSFTGSGGDGAAETAAVTSMQTMEPGVVPTGTRTAPARSPQPTPDFG